MKNGYKYKKDGWGSCIWNVLWPLLYYLLINLVVSFVVMFIIAIKMGLSGATPDATELANASAKAIVPMNIVVQLLCVCIYLPVYLIDKKKSLPKIKEKGPWHLIITGGLFIMTVGLVSAASLSFIGSKINIFSDFYKNLSDTLMSAPTVLMLLTTVILAPLMEELMVRGIILNRILSKTNEWTAIIVSAAIFGIIHMNLFQGLNAFILGIALGYVYVKTRSLLPCIAGHFINNLLSSVESMLGLSTKGIYVFEGIFILIGIVGVILFIKSKKTQLEE